MGVHLGSSSTANLVHKWQANTAYIAGDKVMAPDGTIVSRNSDGTSGSTYTSANWTTVGGAVSSVNGLTGAVTVNEVETVVYSGSVGTIRPSAEFVVWQGFPAQPTNMADGDLWLSDLGGTILSGTAAPTGTDGANGDFYIRTTTSMLYGPKASGSWPSGVSLVGAAGSNGRGITSIARTSGTGAAGTTDTYTITYSDASTSTFTVYNGADGAGAGITVQDEGGALSTAATTINFVGAGVTATGTTSTKTITIPGGGGTSRSRLYYTLPTSGLAATYDRTQMANQGGQTLTSGTLYMAAIVLTAGDVISTVNLRTTSSWTSMTHAWAALYNSGGTVLAVSADDTTASVSSPVNRAYTLGSAYTVPTTGMYFVGFMGAGTGVAILGSSLASAQAATIPPVINGTGGTTLTTPPSVGATATVTPAQIIPYLWVA